jgi:hypothetical protein
MLQLQDSYIALYILVEPPKVNRKLGMKVG